jgi:hypothetical protein
MVMTLVVSVRSPPTKLNKQNYCFDLDVQINYFLTRRIVEKSSSFHEIVPPVESLSCPVIVDLCLRQFDDVNKLYSVMPKPV